MENHLIRSILHTYDSLINIIKRNRQKFIQSSKINIIKNTTKKRIKWDIKDSGGCLKAKNFKKKLIYLNLKL